MGKNFSLFFVARQGLGVSSLIRFALKWLLPGLGDNFALQNRIPPPSFESQSGQEKQYRKMLRILLFVFCCQAGTRTPIPCSRGMCPTIRRPGNIFYFNIPVGRDSVATRPVHLLDILFSKLQNLSKGLSMLQAFASQPLNHAPEACVLPLDDLAALCRKNDNSYGSDELKSSFQFIPTIRPASTARRASLA
jgi:hypothetical protein